MSNRLKSLSRASTIAAKKKRRRTFVRIDITPRICQLDGTPVEITGIPRFIDPPEDIDLIDEEHKHKYEQIGKVLKIKKEFREFLTLKTVITGALLHSVQEEDKGISKEKIMERGQLAMKVYAVSDHYDFSVEQLAMLKDLIRRKWAPMSPLILAQAFDMIDPPKKEEAVQGEKKLSAQETEENGARPKEEEKLSAVA